MYILYTTELIDFGVNFGNFSTNLTTTNNTNIQLNEFVTNSIMNKDDNICKSAAQQTNIDIKY